MNDIKIPNPTFHSGLNEITRFDALDWEDPKNTKMNFGILILNPEENYQSPAGLERAFLLMKGKVFFRWTVPDNETQEQTAERNSLFDDSPSCLHVPKNVDVEILSCDSEAEIAIMETINDNEFETHYYPPEECRLENRGAGTMRETSTRIVRTIFDLSNAPDAKLVLGEVISYPGKWSSYPPHHHPQPEVYHYRYLPEQGFSFAGLGDDVVKVHHGDTVLILNDATHPQVVAPGYAMYLIWVIRHLDDNPYDKPTFEPEHLWVQDPENQKNFWPPEE